MIWQAALHASEGFYVDAAYQNILCEKMTKELFLGLGDDIVFTVQDESFQDGGLRVVIRREHSVYTGRDYYRWSSDCVVFNPNKLDALCSGANDLLRELWGSDSDEWTLWIKAENLKE